MHIDIGTPVLGVRLMIGGNPSGVLRDIGTLFSDGMLGGLTDRQLLERFMDRNDSSAEDVLGQSVNAGPRPDKPH